MEKSLLSFLSFNSIKGNIIKALLSMGAVTACLLLFTWWQSSDLRKEKQRLTEQYQPAQLAIEQHSAKLQKSLLLLQAYLQTGDEIYRTGLEDTWKDYILPAEDKLENILDPLHIQQLNKLLRAVKTNSSTIRQSQQEAINRIRQQLKATGYFNESPTEQQARTQNSIRAQIQRDIVPLILETDKQATLLQAQVSNLHQQSVRNIEAKIEAFRIGGIFALVASIIIAGLLGHLLLKQLARSLHTLKDAVMALGQGNLPAGIKGGKNEVSGITGEVGMLTHHLQEVKELAEKIGEGKFDHSINVFNNKGALGMALAGMKESLSRVAQEDRQRNWVNEGLATFADLMRTHNNTIAELCDVTVSRLVKYVGAKQGAIFLVEEDNTGREGEDYYLNLNACYAYDKRKFLKKKILKGEGLAGQCWQENDTILINDIPADFINIRSGLGGSTPKTILLMPLRVNEETQGILELASFNDFKPYQQEFIRKICENLAAAIGNARNTERTMHLLEESQQLAEALGAQEEEMRQNMEELEATQEEMMRAQQEMQLKEQNLNSVINSTSDTIFSIDTAYRITVVNQFLKDKYKSMGIDLQVGTCISDILPAAAWKKWKARYDRAMAGEQFSVIEESSGSHSSRFSQTYHNPIRNEKGEITGASVISRDVTEIHLNQREIQRKQSTLNAIINSTDDTYFAIDTDYRILIANKTLKERFAINNISLEEGELIFDKLPKDKHPYWKELYDRALAGEAFVVSQERPVGDKVLFIEVYCNPIRDEESGAIMGASVMSKDITKWKKAIDEQAKREHEIQKLRKALGMDTPDEEQVLTKGATAKETKPKKRKEKKPASTR